MRIGTKTVILLLICAGMIWLQIFLSRREGRWPGLMLPIISFLFSLIYPLNMAAVPGLSTLSLLAQLLLVWLMANIPTVILLLIYFACREKFRRKNQMDKMNIQDLS